MNYLDNSKEIKIKSDVQLKVKTKNKLEKCVKAHYVINFISSFQYLLEQKKTIIHIDSFN